MIQLDNQKRCRVARTRKVYYGHYDYEARSPHPVIRLGGKYLEEYGFKIGDTIDVTMEPQRIVITKIDPEPPAHGP